MNRNKNLAGLYYSKIIKSLKYLEYSYNRTLTMPLNPNQMNDAELEAWDSFASRFARTSDIFLSKYIKAQVLNDDPAFDGGFVDQLNRAEKLGLIENVTQWMEIRELRNATVHEYSDQDLEKIFEKFRQFSPLLFRIKNRHLEIFELIPEQKIDITVATAEELRTDDFLKSITGHAVKL